MNHQQQEYKTFFGHIKQLMVQEKSLVKAIKGKPVISEEMNQEKLMKRKQVQLVFEEIFQIGHNLMAVEDLRIQVIVAELFTSFVYVTAKTNMVIFKGHILSII